MTEKILRLIVCCAIGVLAGISLIIYWWIHPSPEILHTVSLPNSPWVIEDRLAGSTSALNGGWTEIVAKNKDIGNEVRIVVFKEPADAKISLGKSNEVVITAPITAGIAERRDAFDGITVVYNFLPEDKSKQ